MDKIKDAKYFHLIAILFVVCLITANLGATKLARFGDIVLPAGILVFPMLYVLNDILTEVYGFTASRKVIWTALICNLGSSILLFAMVQFTPADLHSNQESFENIFGLAPRIVIASVTSYFIGELLNAFTISNLKIMLHGKQFALRAILSTCAGSFLDTLIFISIAFGPFMETKELMSLVITLTITKVLYEIICLPVTVVVASYLKRVEQIDSFEKPSLKAIFEWRL